MSAMSLDLRHNLQLEPDILTPELFKLCIHSRYMTDHLPRELDISKIELLLLDPAWFHVPAGEPTYHALYESSGTTPETRRTGEIGRMEFLEERLHRVHRGGKLLRGDGRMSA